MPKNSNYKPENRTPPNRNDKSNPVKGKTAAEMDADFAKAKKKLKLVAPICIVVIVVAFIFVQRPTKQELILPQHTLAAFYNTQTSETAFVADGGLIDTIDGNAEIIYTELDGTKAIAKDETGALYTVTADGATPGGAVPPAPDYSELFAGISDIDESFPLIANADGTQVLVQTEFGAYICQAGAEPVPIGGDGLNYPFNLWENCETRGEILVYRGTSFFEISYTNENNGKFALYGVGADGTSARYGPLSDTPFVMRANNGSAYYVSNGTIYLMQNSATEVGNNELEENIIPESVCIDAARKRLYFINEAGELRTLKNKGSSRVVAFNVTEVIPARDKGVYYLTSDGQMFSYDGKTSRQILSGLSAGAITVTHNMVWVTSHGGITVYAAPTGARDGSAEFTRVI